MRRHYDRWLLLGEGGEAWVYRARQVSLDRMVAIRVTKPQAVNRAEQEAHTLSALRHNGLATVMDFGVSQGRFHLVQEYVRGVPLSRLAPMPPLLVMELVQSLADTLFYLHSRHLVYGDLHPDNILLAHDRGPVLVDFGMVRPLGSSQGQAMGSVRFFSPEHFLGGPFVASSDVFSLGLLAWTLLTGKHLFDSDDFDSVRSQCLSGVYDVSLVPAPCVRFLMACLQLNADERVQDMEELAEWADIAARELLSEMGPVRAELLRAEARAKRSRAMDDLEFAALEQAAQQAEKDRRFQEAWLHCQEMIALKPPLASELGQRMSDLLARMERGRLAVRLWTVAAVMLLVGLVVLLWTESPVMQGRSMAQQALQEMGKQKGAGDSSEYIAPSHALDSGGLVRVQIPGAEKYSEFLVDDVPHLFNGGVLMLAPGKYRWRARLIDDSSWVSGQLDVPARSE